MKKSYITSIGTAVPIYEITREQSANFVSGVLELSEIAHRKLKILYRASGIEKRYSVLEDSIKTSDFQFFRKNNFPTTAQRMALYEQEALPLALDAIADCFRNQSLDKQEITHLITVSCTGMYAPGLDIEIIEKLNLPSNTKRTCINFMGCYGAFNALKVADAFCRAEKNAKVLIIHVELCTIHLQNSTLPDHLLSNAIFADGASVALIESENRPNSLEINGFYCGLASEGKQDMAWMIRDFGFDMRLSAYVPSILEKNIKNLVEDLCRNLDIELTEIRHFATHPGGKKILESIERALDLPASCHESAYEILKNYGNMSSVTVWFVLSQMMQKYQANQHKNKVLAMAFGPGLTIESAVLGY